MASLGVIPETAVMVFGPRNEDEIGVALKILATPHDFATGKLATPAKVAI